MARIIVIEDEPIVAMDIEETLFGAGFEVIAVVSSLMRAFVILSERPADLLILDADTKDAGRALPWLGVPVVLIRSWDKPRFDGLMSRVSRCSCGVVAKPFPSSRLLTTVDCILAQQIANTAG